MAAKQNTEERHSVLSAQATEFVPGRHQGHVQGRVDFQPYHYANDYYYYPTPNQIYYQDPHLMYQQQMDPGMYQQRGHRRGQGGRGQKRSGYRGQGHRGRGHYHHQDHHQYYEPRHNFESRDSQPGSGRQENFGYSRKIRGNKNKFGEVTQGHPELDRNNDSRELNYDDSARNDQSQGQSRRSTQGHERSGHVTQNLTETDFYNGSVPQGRGRGGRKVYSRGGYKYRHQRAPQKQVDDESQRGSLVEQLSNNTYECMVCCDIVRCEHAVWNCQNCYHVFHLRCVKKWARSPNATVEDGSGWRCPACQNVTLKQPSQYRCFCGKTKDPEWDHYETPHSCGEVCSKSRSGDCTHKCNILCHPGPCPPCHANVTRSCDCGRNKKALKCGETISWRCEEACGKTLNCGRHECQDGCHAGPCEPCAVEIKQTCFCEKEDRSALCGTSEAFETSFSCKEACNRVLSCGNHTCEELCHPGPCDDCPLAPEAVTQCSCGQTLLSELNAAPRTSCDDPVPVCDKTCNKHLPCGSPENPHLCEQPCHVGPCGTCKGETTVKCRCGAYVKDMTCLEAAQYSESNPFLCSKRCQKKRSCGKHRCPNVCCVETDHPCDQICGRKLTCGLHRCEDLCHRGNCHTCWHVSFEELSCYCGAQIHFPPIACGTRPPECPNMCTREHHCNHPVRHTCHSDEQCPPCTALTEKLCMGGHEIRKNIPCYLTDISCGLPCNRLLPCGMHKCQRICHKNACVGEEDDCTLPCTESRSECGHPCGAPCHSGMPCPKTPCKAEVTIKCKCGNLSKKSQCLLGGEGTSDYQKMATSMLAAKMAGLQMGEEVQLGQLMSTSTKPTPRSLECNEDCAVQERNRRLAAALDIQSADTSSKPSTQYNDFLKGMAKSNLTFVTSIEKEMGDLIQLAQQGKSRRSHAFPPMKRDQRRFIHELSEVYGCESQSYDEEPKKNVVITAIRSKSKVPPMTLTTLITRDGKAPMPIPHSSSEEHIRLAAQAARQSTSVTGGLNWAGKVTGSGEGQVKGQPAESSTGWRTVTYAQKSKQTANAKQTASAKQPPKKETIDYFDFTD